MLAITYSIILVEITRYGLKVIAKYQIFRRQADGHLR